MIYPVIGRLMGDWVISSDRSPDQWITSFDHQLTSSTDHDMCP
jgi:hypothetical protein